MLNDSNEMYIGCIACALQKKDKKGILPSLYSKGLWTGE
jgi:hypothetical protein